MKIHRFFITESIQPHSAFRSEEKGLVHQLRDVFRMKKGDSVLLFDGTGYEFEAELELVTRKEAVFTIGQGEIKEQKGTGAHLFLSIIKKDKFELAIEKATELGVEKITPIIAERSQYKSIRPERLQRVITEAAEQCGRVTIPELTPELTLEVALEQYSDMVVLDMDGEEGVVGKNILIGPEGGWSEKEREMFKQKEVSLVSLPFDTLRAETAVVAVLSRMV